MTGLAGRWRFSRAVSQIPADQATAGATRTPMWLPPLVPGRGTRLGGSLGPWSVLVNDGTAVLGWSQTGGSRSEDACGLWWVPSCPGGLRGELLLLGAGRLARYGRGDSGRTCAACPGMWGMTRYRSRAWVTPAVSGARYEEASRGCLTAADGAQCGRCRALPM